MKTSIVIALALVIHYSESSSQVVINEIMYAPTDASNEWFEIYNTGSESINIQNWKWKDATASARTITTQSVIMQENSFAVICQDSNKIKIQFPSLTGIFIQTAWSTLNNTGDNVILMSSSNIRVDSVLYQNSWGGSTGGFSLERINPDGISNDASNWGTSFDLLKATPNKQNSVTPKANDLFLKSFSLSPLFPSAGEILVMEFVIKNSGLNTAESFSLNIFKDSGFDSIPDISELIKSMSFTQLISFDSIIYNYTIENIDSGYKQYIAKVYYENDDDTLNNIIIKKIYVSSQAGTGSGVIINEIMYDPLSNQSEWIELLNASGQTLNMKNWKYKEATTTITLSVNDLYLNPGDYFILAHDSSIYSTFDYLRTPEINQIIKFSSGIGLNNTGENISITDSLNNIIDAVNYSPGWNNPELVDTKGISLERINSAFETNDRNNWSSCTFIKGGTPGRNNSIFTNSINSSSVVSINPHPFSPDDDGHEDFTIIKYKLNISFAQMRVKVFDVKGRLVRTLANNVITGSEGAIIFNGLGDDNQKLRIGIYILLIEAVDNIGGTVDVVKEPIVIAGKL